MKIGIFFGSFNPIHQGHIAIAKRFLQEKDLDAVWLSVSPHNPLKEKDGLIDSALRVAMADLATRHILGIKVTDFEKALPQPSYTYEALLYLKEQYPLDEFVLLIGGDNCGLFDKWRNYTRILTAFRVWAYPRHKDDINTHLAKQIRIIDAPLLDYASTDIREAIASGDEPKGLNPEVKRFINEKKLYKK